MNHKRHGFARLCTAKMLSPIANPEIQAQLLLISKSTWSSLDRKPAEKMLCTY